VSGAGWYDIGATAKFSVDASVPIDSGSRYYCSGYNGDATGSGNSGTVVMTGSKTITFQWQKQFLLTLVSQYGTKSGDGWYDVDATAQFSVSAKEEAGVRYRFLSWAGDFAGTSPSGSVVMDGPKTTTANWKRELKTQLTFRDGDGQVLAKPPSKVVLSGPSGPVAFEAVNDVWLEEGAWSVQQVIYDGAEVSAGDFPFTASAPNATWEIAVQVYSLHVTVKGTLLQSSVVGSTVTVTLPDGSTASASMSNGTAVLAQLPAGRYNVQATGGLIPASTTVDLDHTRDLQVRVLGAIDAGAIAAIGAISAASAVLYMRWRKGHPATREEEKGAEEVEGGEEKKPLPPPPPDEETGSLKDFYKRSKS
jgi:hypothetical protein